MRKFLGLLLLGILILAGCIKTVPFNGPSFEEHKLVIFAVLGPDIGIKVMVQRPHKITDSDSTILNIRARVVLESDSGGRWTVDSFAPGVYEKPNFVPHKGVYYRLIVSAPDYPTAVSEWVSLPDKIKLLSLSYSTNYNYNDFNLEGFSKQDFANSKYVYHLVFTVPPNVAYYTINAQDSLGKYYSDGCYKYAIIDTDLYMVLPQIPSDLLDSDQFYIFFYSYNEAGLNLYYNACYVNNNYDLIWKKTFSNFKNAIGGFITYNFLKIKIPVK